MVQRRVTAVTALIGLLAGLLALTASPAPAQEVPTPVVALSGVVDGPLTGGLPKVVEITALADVADTTSIGIGVASNGNPSDGIEFTLPAGSLAAGSSICLATETDGFTDFFGFGPDAVTGVVNINGDDAVELWVDDTLVDTYGVAGTDGSGESWDHLDGWAKRIAGTVPVDPAGLFDESHWTFSGVDALDDAAGADNDASANPFPISCDGTGLVTDDGGDGGDEEPVEAFIHDVQGTATTAAMNGQTVTVAGIVVGTQVDADAIEGYFVQEEDADADADPATSEGIFVFCDGPCSDTEAAVGDQVTVTGDVSEFGGQTQIAFPDAFEIVATDQPMPTPAVVNMPAPAGTDEAATFEAVESMLVTIPQDMVVSEYFQLARFGELVLTVDERPFQYTQTNTPDAAGYEAFLDDLATRTIVLADNSVDENNEIDGPTSDSAYPFPTGGLSVDNRFRGGDTFVDLTGVMAYFENSSGSVRQWSIRPVEEIYDYTPEATNPAPTEVPDVGGDVVVAAFNVLNYYVSVNDGSTLCGPAGDQECRGAHSAAELDNQTDKIVAALDAIGADVFGLMEIENDGDDASAHRLADELSTLSGADYQVVETGFIGTDAIKQALIYDADTVTPVGDFDLLTGADDPRYDDSANRPSLIQTFETVDGERFTVSVNHLKSKGSACSGDPDLGDGAGNCNVTRTDAAEALADHLATDPTGSGSDRFLIIGDLNSYAAEDPIVALEDAGYVDTAAAFGADVYSYVFDGQIGTLDYAMASPGLIDDVAGAATWAINADEIPLFDYNDDVEDAEEAWFDRKSSALELFAPDALRASDHDPVIVGLTFDDAPLVCDGLEEPPFVDVSLDSPFCGYIARMVDSGLTQGYGDGTYRPTTPVSRQVMVAVAFRLFDDEEVPPCEEAPFSDVAVDSLFCGEIRWMVDVGLATGYDDGTFRPTEPVTRQTMAVFLARLLEASTPACEEAPFSDVPVDSELCSYIAWMAAEGFTEGYPDGTFRPTEPVTRQTLAAFLNRFSV